MRLEESAQCLIEIHHLHRHVGDVHRADTETIQAGVFDARVAAAHLQALLDAGILLPRLFGAKQEFKTKDAVRAAVEVFLSAYRLP